MKNKKLREFLTGERSSKETLVEYNAMSPGSLSDLVNANRTTRQERLGQAWQDFIMQIEALWLDVLDEVPEMYDEADQYLKELRKTPPEACRMAEQPVEALTAVLTNSMEGDDDVGLFAARMQHMAVELAYICDTFDPNVPFVPGAPVKSKRQWMKGQDAPDMSYSVPGADNGEEGEEGSNNPFADGDEKSDDDEEGGSPFGGGGDEDGDDGEEGDEEDKGSPFAKGDDDEEGDEEGEEEEEDKGSPFGGDDSDEGEGEEEEGDEEDKGSPFDKGDDDEEPEDNFGGKIAKDDGEGDEEDEDEDDDDEDEKNESRKGQPRGPVSSIILSTFVSAEDSLSEVSRESDAEYLEAGEILRVAIEGLSDVHSARTEIGQIAPGSAPRIDVFMEWVVNESGLPTGEYWKSIKGKEKPKSTGTAGWMDKKSDKATTKSRAGATKKGSGYAGWMESARLSDCYGYSTIQVIGPSVIVGNKDGTKAVFQMTEKTTDQDVVDAVYEAMSVVYDVSNDRTLGETSVVSALKRLVEARSRGEDTPKSAFIQVLSALRPRLSLSENVRVVSQVIDINEGGDFSDVYNYYYSWAVRIPLTHDSEDIPDEIGQDTMDEPPPDEGWDFYEAKNTCRNCGSKVAPSEMRGSNCRKCDSEINIGDKLPGKSFGEAIGKTAEGLTHWRTPDICVNFTECKVSIKKENGEEEEIGDEETDEDITARLASMAYQKENIQTGHIIETDAPSPEDLEVMSTDELHKIAVDLGLKVPGDGVTWDREHLISAIEEL